MPARAAVGKLSAALPQHNSNLKAFIRLQFVRLIRLRIARPILLVERFHDEGNREDLA